jgi:hypothetical protein
MTDTYYAANKTKQFSDMVKEGVRDLRSKALAPYYEVPSVPDSEISSRYEESADFRSENDLPPVTESSFSSQISKGFGKDTFIQFLGEMGIEIQVTDDLFEDDPGERIPQIPGLTDLIHDLVRMGFEIDTSALMRTFPGLDLSSEPVLHLREDAPSIWAEEDQTVAARLRKAKTYTRLYLQGG